MLFERRADLLISRIVGGDVSKCDTAQFGSKARPEREDFHGRTPSLLQVSA
jgi:hypothetical protein